MKITLTLTLNIGTTDARRLGLEKTLDGDEVEVTEDVGNLMVKRGWALPATTVAAPDPIVSSAHLPADRGAVASGEPTSEAPEAPGSPDLEEMTKPQLLEYAASLGLGDIPERTAKADIVAEIKQHLDAS